MAIPNEKLTKLVQEIEAQAVQAQRDIHSVKAAIVAKQRDARILDLTATELHNVSSTSGIYEGVGKMFMAASSEDVSKRLQNDASAIRQEVGALDKKLNYLETTHRNSREHMEQIFKRGGAG